MKPGLQFTRDRERTNSRNEILERLDAALRKPNRDASRSAKRTLFPAEMRLPWGPRFSRPPLLKNAKLGAVSKALRNLLTARSTA
jgi:hypothetical protein